MSHWLLGRLRGGWTEAIVPLVVAAVVLILARPALACTTIIVGKSASPNGAVLLAHNEDDGDYCQYVKAFPATTSSPGATYSTYLPTSSTVPMPTTALPYVASLIYNKTVNPGDIDSTLNCNQVAIVDNLAESWTDDANLDDYGPSTGLIWSELNQLAAMQATSARNAVQIIGALVQKYGLGMDTGTLFGIADANEGWWMEISGHEWCAERVPDNAVQMRANAYGIGNVNFNDPTDFMWSSDIVTFAQARNLPGCNNNPFNWQTSYMYPGLTSWGFNSERLAMIPLKLAAYQAAQGSVSKQDLMAVMRWHYEGTPEDPSNGYERDPNYCNDPNGGTPYTVCNNDTIMSSVTELRNWLPNCIGGVMWQAMRMPDQSVYVPWYAGITTTPGEYATGGKKSSSTSAYWAFTNLASWVHSDYKNRIGAVKSAWRSFERAEFAAQASVESTALQDYATNPASAAQYLTNYSDSRGHQAYVDALSSTPSLSLKSSTHSVKVGDKVVLSGDVRHHVSSSGSVLIVRKLKGKLKLLKRVTCNKTGDFRWTWKTAKVGKWVLTAIYKVGTAKFSSKPLAVTVHK